MTNSIAIVGMACVYPDARSPSELWENVLAQRRAFRRIPDERLRLADYLSSDRQAPDCFYSTNAALIEGYEFDRSRYRIAGSTFRSADFAHWLALDVAAQALADAGFIEADRMPRETTGVFLGNTLTGEFSRANVLRLRWPYVRRIIEASLAAEGWSVERRNVFLKSVEADYKKPFPPISEETLAGGLSNTIAGRICNHFNFQGGGYTVDGACASSLLAIANGCAALKAGDLDAVVAGGVDLSLDPFELVGFAKAGALASDEMRIYDVRSNGFWPGEGCGFVLLMRHEDAVAERLHVYGVIRGWGVSSDGNGGITRPEVEGQLLALRRAYIQAGFGIETVAYFEGHGTGTLVGDAVELQALSEARREAGDRTSTAAIGSIKANIGHTKAAAGIAGVIKAAFALGAGIIPPTTGCEEPHPMVGGIFPSLRTPKTAELWPERQALRAGISSMGFGGINAHVVVDAEERATRRKISTREHALISSFQDAELFLLGAQTSDQLQRQVDHLLAFAARLSRAELSDLAAQLENRLEIHKVRAAVVACRPSDLADSLTKLRTIIATGKTEIDHQNGIFLSALTTRPRIGFLFPGQGTPSHFQGGALRRRFDFIQEIYASAQLDESVDETATLTAQPAIVTASIAALRALNKLNISAEVAVGHSLGELTAMHWAGAMDEESLLRIARARSRTMMNEGNSSGAMASIGAGEEDVLALLNGEDVCIAGLNSANQTVISGEVFSVNQVMLHAREKNLSAVKLPVSHAFHSRLVAAAAADLATHLSNEEFKPLHREVVSTITGKQLASDANLRDLLCRQVTSPVRFMEAVNTANSETVDLWLEVGPGRVLKGIMSEITETPVVSLDAGGESLGGLLCATAAAFVLGAPVNHQVLFAGRFTKPFDLDWRPRFFANPCELAPVPETMGKSGAGEETSRVIEEQSEPETGPALRSESSKTSILALVTELVAKRAELPTSLVTPDSRLLADLHLNSITVSQVVAETARRLRLSRPVSSTDFADARLRDVADAFDEQLMVGASSVSEANSIPAGLDSWVRPFCVELVERQLPRHKRSQPIGGWQVLANRGDSFGESLRQKFAECEVGSGVVVCLPRNPDEAIVSQLLEAARLAFKAEGGTIFVLVQDGKGAAAFARTVHLEAPRVTTCVVSVPRTDPRALDWVVAEALAAEGYVEAHYDEQGRRYEPVVRPLPAFDQAGELPLSADDVLVITGGGKGITAECALALAKETGARLALIGRALPDTDEELASNLKRMAAYGVDLRYISADVTDAIQVRDAVQRFEEDLGPITGILHGAARNVPQLLDSLDEETFRRTLAVKVQGAQNLLAAINPEKLRLLVTFGSIIARTGLPGEADYGLANEWLTNVTEEWKSEHPACRCLAVEWSVWSGKGMGERLGRADRLVQQGITPIPPDEGVVALLNLLRQPLPLTSVIVMSRFRDLSTFKLERTDLPFLRFLEQPRVFYPGVELVVDVDLSTTTDPYLDDHVFQGERFLPAVMGLEAMTQAAMALLGSARVPILENVRFIRPVIVPTAKPLKIRLAALRRGPSLVEVALQSEETAFQVNHFQATCRFEDAKPAVVPDDAIESSLVSLDPAQDLYGRILFQAGRFQRLSNYRVLRATECVAEITPNGNSEWFNRYLPGDLVLGDPGARDAALHAIQACIPHATILPVGVDRLSLSHIPLSGPLFVHATESARDGNNFTYNLTVSNADGRVFERWEGLRLRAVADRPIPDAWTESLLAPYLERRVQELIPGCSISVALVRSLETDRRARSDRAIQMALRENVEILHRPDGRPEVAGERSVSASHAGDLTLAVAGSGRIGCDIEEVVDRSSSVWLDLLGKNGYELAHLIARSASEEEAVSATRVWAAGECLKKAGAMINGTFSLASSSAEGWAVLTSGQLTIGTYLTQIRNQAKRFVLSVAGQPRLRP
jgi:enediyne polyketide synthase